MSRRTQIWTQLGVLLMPWLYLGFAALLCAGLRDQPHVVRAGNADQFAISVRAAGGTESVRIGLMLDFVFIGLFVVLTVAVLGKHVVALLPLIPAALDVAENVLLERVLSGGDHLQLLRGIAIIKLAAYLATLLLVAIFLVRRFLREN
ncbi:hypothetical protein [Nocardioides zhouii]|uniref:Uncharacterized protein n=1 Tax=Nocardioides zhouii TaxID=1168729 RepID=A0A4Q2SEY7_9ACTN|nr:hypothetical protein [Nocardioides zhouii]RYC03321.1 hypothetical protein EUA94_21880 [Nocardioides zhouii]